MKTHIVSAFYLCLGLVLADTDRLELQSQSIIHPEKHGLHGTINEDAQAGEEVILDPPLEVIHKAKDEDVCGFTLYKSESDVPFTLEKVEGSPGSARVVLAPNQVLDYETRKQYSFHVAAKDCKGEHSRRVKVHVHVQDVNEHKPRFDQSSYVVEVLEGRKYDQILLLTATDEDGSDSFSSICHYHILTPNVPFEINSNGVFHNTEALDYSHNHNYILEVTAEDCGKEKSLTSAKILISVKVREGCKPGWKGIEDKMDYFPGSGQKSIGDSASLHMCDQCQEKKVVARVRLTTQHIGKGCDRDTYSIQSQRKLCGASSGSVDLLSLVRGLKTDDGAESDQIFSFDGKTAVEVASQRFNHTLGSHFTISTWMKHSDHNQGKKHGPKETIVCNSDADSMNRHHYSLFLHNCHLVFLIRQEPDQGVDMNTFKPAEYRWKIPQVCDGEWHHYALSVDFPEQLRLYIDGKLFVETQDNPDIVDDWPLHKTKIKFTKLFVGGCWQGGVHKQQQHLTGYLAGLSILKGKTESDRVIKCLNNCKEKLDFQAVDKMDTGMSISLNSEMTEIEIKGMNHTSVERLVRQVGYVNARTYPTPGNRALTVETEVECEESQQIVIPTVHSNVLVHPAERPIITISGETVLPHKLQEFPMGVLLFDSLRIISRSRKEEQELKANDASLQSDYLEQSASKYNLDICHIEADSNINSNTESFKYNAALATNMGLSIEPTDQGLKIAGADKVAVYEEVIRDIRYVNIQPQDFTDRTFTLQCSELNGRFKSNIFTIKVNFLHKTHKVDEPEANAQANSFHHEQAGFKAQDGEPAMGLESSIAKDVAHGASTASAGMIVIIVVCVGFLMFMIVLGVIRIRAAHARDQVLTVESDRPEMEWDHSELNITINPMEQETVDFEAEGGMQGDDTDSDDESDIVSYQDEMESSEEEPEKVQEVLKGQALEWDDSTF